jgi:hypothetical protein
MGGTPPTKSGKKTFLDQDSYNRAQKEAKRVFLVDLKKEVIGINTCV